MDIKDYYSLREIVLGLREEYLKYYEKVEKLKSLCTVDEKKVADFDFRIIQHFFAREEGKLPELSCAYEERLNRIQVFLRDIGSRILCYPNEKTKIGRLSSDNGRFYINSCYDNFPIQIIGEKENEEFFEQANEILNSQFANGIDMYTWYNAYIADKGKIPLPKNIPGEFQDTSINVFSSWFKVTMHMKNSNLRTFWLFYKPCTDSLEVSAFGKDRRYKIDEETVNDILAIEYPTDRLGQYHIDIIDSFSKKDKDVSIECFDARNKVKLDIEEDEKEIVFCKSRKN